MTTSEIEALYIKHADDFKTLLGVGPYGCVALFADNIRLFIPNETVTSWHTGQQPIVTALAVAAMESAWRSKLKAEYEDYPLVGEKWEGTYSLPQRICMVVKALAAEKRAEAGMEKMGFERVEAVPASSAEIAKCWIGAEPLSDYAINIDNLVAEGRWGDFVCLINHDGTHSVQTELREGQEAGGYRIATGVPGKAVEFTGGYPAPAFADHPKSEPPQNTKPADIAKRIAGSAASMAAKFQPDDDPIVAAMHLGNLAALVSSLATRVAEIGGEQA